MYYDDEPRRRQNRSYYSDEHGYVCDCRRSIEPYEQLCPQCQDYVDSERELEEDEDNDNHEDE